MSEIIEVTSGRLTSTSSIACMIVLFVFLYLVIHFVAKIYRNVYKNEIPNYLSLDNIFYFGLDDVLKSYYEGTNNTSDSPNKQTINNIMNDLKDELPKYANKMATNTNTNKINNDLQADIDSKLTTLKSITTKIQTIQSNQIKDLEGKYTVYQQKIQGYVDNLKKMMDKIGIQIVTIKDNTTYKTMVNPLVQIFTSIKTALEKNKDFIKKAYPGYIAPTTTLPILTSNIVSATNETPNILSRAGYIV